MQFLLSLFISCIVLINWSHGGEFVPPYQDSLQEIFIPRLDDEELRPQFESPEHAAIGNQTVLRYPSSTVNGSNFNYNVHGTKLSFGDIIALAGDYFFHWKIGDCAPSLSKTWNSSHDAGIALANDTVNLLRRDWEGFLRCVLNGIHDQGNEVRNARFKGKDSAQVYNAIGNSYDFRFAKCTLAGYAIISLCNFDHFGKDAERAYTAVHTLALQQAADASKNKDPFKLTEAYFTEAYAQHYLTDMFATGHIRTPRRELHTGFDITFAPADRCGQEQHGEDGANGLWVTNREGRSWAAYGDRQYDQGRSAKNRQVLQEASQAGVDEVWDTFNSGKVPEASKFRALQKTPIPEKAFGNNFIPLFQVSETGILRFRQDVDQRAVSRSMQTFSSKPDNLIFTYLHHTIEDSGPSLNRYVYTKSFASEQKFLHIGQYDPANPGVVANLYGTVDAGTFGQYWGMSSQGTANLAAGTEKKMMTDAQSLGSGLFSLIGREGKTSTTSLAVHVGLKVSQNSMGLLDIDVLWDQTFVDGNGNLAAGETLYGNFDRDSQDQIMVKYFEGQRSDSKLEFWSLPSRSNDKPAKLSELNTAKLNFLISHKISRSDSFSTVVGYASGPQSGSASSWHFCSWNNSYERPIFTTAPGSSVRRAQALLSDPDAGRLIRISYGQQYPGNAAIQLDILHPKRNEGNGAIVFDGEPQTQKFSITWRALIEQDYLLWFVHDVNGDGLADIVTYTSDASHTYLNVVVFPGRSSGLFGTPVVSPITVDPTIGKLFAAEFMTPLYTSRASYTYSTTGDRTTGAIMSFFDNYGIIATRTIAPETSSGSYRYELKGQDPSIAGQRSLTLGERPGTWMGLNRRAQRVGVVPW